MRDLSNLRLKLLDVLPPGAVIDRALDPSVPWAPHAYDKVGNVAWQVLPEPLESSRWADRMAGAAAAVPGLAIGVCAPMAVLKDRNTLDDIDRIGAQVAAIEEDETTDVRLHDSAADLIWEARLILGHDAAGAILDRWLDRCGAAESPQQKGVALEVLTAVMLSQVAGFEVKNRGAKNRSQQMDVKVHNRRTAGILGNSEVVFAEAKNWADPVGTPEYFSILRKIQTSYGRSRLGIFVTTDRFTSGVTTERIRDSRHNVLIVPLDRNSLPGIWRTGKSITENLEFAAMDSMN